MQYVDISHFRAPYKNANIAGFGGKIMTYSANPYGTVQTPPAPPPPPQEKADNPFVEVDERGYRFVASGLQKTLMKALSNYGAVFMSPTRVGIVPYTVEELNIAKSSPEAAKQLKDRSAKTWIDKQVDADGVVFMTTATLAAVLTGQALPPGGNEMGSFAVGSDEAKQAAKAGYGVVIAGDPEKSGIAGMSPWMIGLLAAGVVGGGFLIFRKKPHRVRSKRLAAMTM